MVAEGPQPPPAFCGLDGVGVELCVELGDIWVAGRLVAVALEGLADVADGVEERGGVEVLGAGSVISEGHINLHKCRSLLTVI